MHMYIFFDQEEEMRRLKSSALHIAERPRDYDLP